MDIDLSPYAGKKICVALSGGGDSVALFHYLWRHGGEYGISLSAVHCEHGIRGEESKDDARFVRRLCDGCGVPLYFFAEDCPKKAREDKTSLETAARAFRYAAFQSILDEGKADVIATAHHADDNAETVLFRLCRGSSLTGLKGISEREGFIRPLLRAGKEEISAYLQEQNLPFREDATNDSEDATRNLIRKRVLPPLKQAIPGTVQNISRFSLSAREDDEYLYALAKPYCIQREDNILLLPAPAPLFRRAALLALLAFGVGSDYAFSHLAALTALAEGETGKKASLPKNVTAIKEYDGVVLFREEQKCEDEIPFAVGESRLGGVRIVVRKEKEQGALRLDLKKLPEGCVFRFRRAGDVIKPFGSGTKKLKEFFIDKKIPRRERDNFPLIAKGNEIFCVCGAEISDKVKTDADSDVYYISIHFL